jgi:hypothetical protein
MQGKQAKIVSPTQERAILGYLATTRYPSRDRVLFLLSMKAGLRAKEMASLTWAMVTDAQGQVAEVLHVPNRASKGIIAVGMPVTRHPPRRSVRADFPHTAPTSGVWRRMLDAHAPTHATQAPGSASGLRAIGTCSPWSTAFPPPPP